MKMLFDDQINKVDFKQLVIQNTHIFAIPATLPPAKNVKRVLVSTKK